MKRWSIGVLAAALAACGTGGGAVPRDAATGGDDVAADAPDAGDPSGDDASEPGDAGTTSDAGDAGTTSDAAAPGDASTASRCTQDAVRVACTDATLELATSLPADGTRAVHWQVPLGTPPAAGWPVVLMFQGSFISAALIWQGQTGEAFGMYAQAAVIKSLLDAGYAVVAPETRGAGSTYWDTNIPPWSADWTASGDHRLMLAIFDALGRGTFGPVDTTRMFAAGLSSGGYMTSRMAVSYNGRFRALAIESASYATCGPTCTVPALPADHPPTLFLHGQMDTIVPIATMQSYAAALAAQHTPTRVVVDPTAGHQWIDAAPGEVLAWFVAHDAH